MEAEASTAPLDIGQIEVNAFCRFREVILAGSLDTKEAEVPRREENDGEGELEEGPKVGREEGLGEGREEELGEGQEEDVEEGPKVGREEELGEGREEELEERPKVGREEEVEEG